VQPVGPLEFGDNDPFSSKIITRADGSKMLTGRGTAYARGKLMTFVEACRAWKAVAGRLPIPITVLLGGEEELGGVNLPPFLDANLEELRADIALIRRPGDHHQLARSLRRGDYHPRRRPRPHSEFYGSAATNPIQVLAKIIARQPGYPNGCITLPASTMAYASFPDNLRRSWDKLGFSGKKFSGGSPLGARTVGKLNSKEPNHERQQFAPGCESGRGAPDALSVRGRCHRRRKGHWRGRHRRAEEGRRAGLGHPL
jgi:acetylornithine deacetylase/succinyl-diaminopimelate desuccinylase-like protein